VIIRVGLAVIVFTRAYILGDSLGKSVALTAPIIVPAAYALFEVGHCTFCASVLVGDDSVHVRRSNAPERRTDECAVSYFGS
jgi:hypothetical protein